MPTTALAADSVITPVILVRTISKIAKLIPCLQLGVLTIYCIVEGGGDGKYASQSNS